MNFVGNLDELHSLKPLNFLDIKFYLILPPFLKITFPGTGGNTVGGVGFIPPP